MMNKNFYLEKGDRVIVRNGNGIWIEDIFESYPSYNSKYPYVCQGGLFQECIAYQGNEDIIGTNESYSNLHKKCLRVGDDYFYPRISFSWLSPCKTTWNGSKGDVVRLKNNLVFDDEHKCLKKCEEINDVLKYLK